MRDPVHPTPVNGFLFDILGTSLIVSKVSVSVKTHQRSLLKMYRIVVGPTFKQGECCKLDVATRSVSGRALTLLLLLFERAFGERIDPIHQRVRRHLLNYSCNPELLIQKRFTHWSPKVHCSHAQLAVCLFHSLFKCWGLSPALS